jgi:hypothetical protein
MCEDTTMDQTTPNNPDDTEPTQAPTSAGDGWVEQLQRMIDDVGRQAGPVMRRVAAKAAELAAVAGEKAGPLAHKAAVKTEEIGIMVAEKGKEMAADLRRAGSEGGNGASATEMPAAEAPAEPAVAEAPAEAAPTA